MINQDMLSLLDSSTPVSRGVAPTFSEAFASMRDQTRYVDTFGATDRLRAGAVQKAVSTYTELFGPMTAMPEDTVYSPESGAADDYAARVSAAVKEKLEENPQYADKFRLDFDNVVTEQMRQYEFSNAELSERLSGASGWAGYLAGGVLGSFESPLFLASLPFGAGAGSTVMRGIAAEALAGAVGTAIEQVPVQAQRAEAGLEHGWDQAVVNTAYGALGGGIFYGGLRALGYVGGKALRALPPGIPDLVPVSFRETAAAFAPDAGRQAVNPPTARMGFDVEGWNAVFERAAAQADTMHAFPFEGISGDVMDPIPARVQPHAEALLKQVDIGLARLYSGQPLDPFVMDPLAFRPDMRAAPGVSRIALEAMTPGERAVAGEMEIAVRAMGAAAEADRVRVLEARLTTARGSKNEAMAALLSAERDVAEARSARAATLEAAQSLDAPTAGTLRTVSPHFDDATAAGLNEIARELEAKGLKRGRRSALTAQARTILASEPDLEARLATAAEEIEARTAEHMTAREAAREVMERARKDALGARKAIDNSVQRALPDRVPTAEEARAAELARAVQKAEVARAAQGTEGARVALGTEAYFREAYNNVSRVHAQTMASFSPDGGRGLPVEVSDRVRSQVAHAVAHAEDVTARAQPAAIETAAQSNMVNLSRAERMLAESGTDTLEFDGRTLTAKEVKAEAGELDRIIRELEECING